MRKKRNGTEIKKIFVEMPDLAAGACTLPESVAAVRAAQSDDRTAATLKARKQAKKICLEQCSVMLRCRDYILAAESPAGSWGGVWGGLNADDRRRVNGKH